jgi:hypothetical protein
MAVESHYILFAENDLDSRLGPYFAVPFSSNNVTATDLSIDLSYARVIIYDDPKKYEAIMGRVNGMIDDLIAGTVSMVTDSGDLITSSNANEAWSNTMGYHGAFGVGDFVDFQVDSSQLYDEESERL